MSLEFMTSVAMSAKCVGTTTKKTHQALEQRILTARKLVNIDVSEAALGYIGMAWFIRKGYATVLKISPYRAHQMSVLGW